MLLTSETLLLLLLSHNSVDWGIQKKLFFYWFGKSVTFKSKSHHIQQNYFNIQLSHLLEKLFFPSILTCVSSSRSWTLVGSCKWIWNSTHALNLSKLDRLSTEYCVMLFGASLKAKHGVFYFDWEFTEIELLWKLLANSRYFFAKKF